MQNIVIDEEFKGLLPALDKETFKSLEENILQNGCRDPLVLWENILIDGHNRYEICTKHDIPFNTVDKDFKSREEVLIWIISNQVSRRNMTPIQLSYCRGRHYIAEKKIVTNAGGKNQYSEVVPQNGEQAKTLSTVTRLADKYKVSKNTIERDAKLSDAIDKIGETSPEVKRQILAGESKIDKKVLEGLALKPKEEISELTLSIEDGTYEKKKPGSSEQKENNGGAMTMHAGTTPLSAEIANMTSGYAAELIKHTENGNTEELKTTLRAFIDKLEDLYKRV